MIKAIQNLLLVSLFFVSSINGFAQTNYFLSNPIAEEILLGNYSPSDYAASTVITDKDAVIEGLVNDVSRDELLDLLIFLDTFDNRNTGSDTLAMNTGIGACRDWILSTFDLISRNNESRLVTGFLEFDADVCGTSHHKNPFAILPGSDTTYKEILVIEGHFDTRNEDGCDTEGYTPGSDDNGSGTVLVMEAARILAKYTFKRTILFTTPTGEDQGLWGAKAWANYIDSKSIGVLACLNNDVVGGIYCGKTSSPPSCPYYGHVDSTNVRIFSYVRGKNPQNYSSHKQLARLVKIVQEEEINPLIDTPMTINIMTAEDRSGRSGDHIPFRQKGITAIRFCSANEHGNGGGNYPDRQHSTRDLLGVDIDGDGKLDSLYVDPGYLERNTLINAAMLAHLANSKSNPTFTMTPVNSGAKITVSNADSDISGYRVGVRYKSYRSNEFDEVYEIGNLSEFEIKVNPGSRTLISVVPMFNGYFGKFSSEFELNLMTSDPLEKETGCRIEKIFPNPNHGIIKLELVNSYASNPDLEFHLYDLMGKLIICERVEASLGKSYTSVQTNDLEAGIYFAKLASNDFVSLPQQLIVMPNK